MIKTIPTQLHKPFPCSSNPVRAITKLNKVLLCLLLLHSSLIFSTFSGHPTKGRFPWPLCDLWEVSQLQCVALEWGGALQHFASCNLSEPRWAPPLKEGSWTNAYLARSRRCDKRNNLAPAMTSMTSRKPDRLHIQGPITPNCEHFR